MQSIFPGWRRFAQWEIRRWNLCSKFSDLVKFYISYLYFILFSKDKLGHIYNLFVSVKMIFRWRFRSERNLLLFFSTLLFSLEGGLVFCFLFNFSFPFFWFLFLSFNRTQVYLGCCCFVAFNDALCFSAFKCHLELAVPNHNFGNIWTEIKYFKLNWIW